MPLGSAGVPWGSEEARGSSVCPCLGSGSLALFAEHQDQIGQLCKQNQGPWPAAQGVSRHRGRRWACGHTAYETGLGRASSPRPRGPGLAQGSWPMGARVPQHRSECLQTPASWFQKMTLMMLVKVKEECYHLAAHTLALSSVLLI